MHSDTPFGSSTGGVIEDDDDDDDDDDEDDDAAKRVTATNAASANSSQSASGGVKLDVRGGTASGTPSYVDVSSESPDALRFLALDIALVTLPKRIDTDVLSCSSAVRTYIYMKRR
jgi:hypothetical protein